MSADLDSGHVTAWPTTNTPYTGRHRWNRGGPTTPDGRRQITNTVDPSHRLTPAATQLATRTRQPIHADIDQDTGLLAPRDITPTGAWTRTAAVTTPAEVLDALDRWVEDGCPINDQTTEGDDR